MAADDEFGYVYASDKPNAIRKFYADPDRGGLGLALESGFEIGVGGQMRRQKFESDFAVQLRVFGKINLAHAAFTELDEDFVPPCGTPKSGIVGDGLADLWRASINPT